MLQLKFLIKVEPFPSGVCTLSHFSCVWQRPRGLAHPIPLPMGFSRQEYWSGLPSLPPGESFQLRNRTCFFYIYLHWQAVSLPLVPPEKPVPCPVSQIYVWFSKRLFPFLKNHQPAPADQSHFESTQIWVLIPVNGSHPSHSSQSLKFSIFMLWEQLSKSPSHQKKKKKKKHHPKGNRKESQSLRESLHGTYRWQRAWFRISKECLQVNNNNKANPRYTMDKNLEWILH